MHDSLLDKLAEGLAALPLELNASVQSGLIDYLHLLVKWNRGDKPARVSHPERAGLCARCTETGVV